MSVQRLATETWMTILRYAISVPVFFDSDPITNYGIDITVRQYDDTAPYYEAERTRNRLRRVCSSWNVYLTNYPYRYVLLSDVLHGDIPIDVVYTAKRLNISTCRKMCCVERNATIPNPDLELLHRVGKMGPELWSLEILDGLNWDLKYFEALNVKGGGLKAMVNRPAHEAETALQLSNLLFFHAPYGQLTTSRSFSHSQITTLTINVQSLSACGTWRLPSLQTFVFRVGTMVISDYLDMLRAFGKGLRNLYDKTFTPTLTLPLEMWELCPHLEQFKTSFQWSPESVIPSSLQRLHIGMRLPANRDIGVVIARVPLMAMHRAGIKSIGTGETWWATMRALEGREEFISFALDNDLDLYDDTGTLFQDFIIQIIRAFYKGESHDGFYANVIPVPLFGL